MFISGVYYKVVKRGTGEVVHDFSKSKAGCFASYTASGGKLKGDQSVYLYINKRQRRDSSPSIYGTKENNYTPLTREQVLYHYDQLNKEGFLNRVDETEDQYIVVANEWDYFNMSHYRIGLDYFRMIFEIGPHAVAQFYWKIPEDQRNKVSYFEAVQGIYIWFRQKGKANNGHYLPCCCSYSMEGGPVPRGSILKGSEILEFHYDREHGTGSMTSYYEIMMLKSGKSDARGSRYSGYTSYNGGGLVEISKFDLTTDCGLAKLVEHLSIPKEKSLSLRTKIK
jgi:hypothetical protein